MKRAASATVFGCAAVLLAYPGEDFAADMAAVGAAIPRLPAGRARNHLEEALGWLSAMTEIQAARVYVETFDLSRATCLYVTYYRHGDTRERGMALTALIDAYRAAGYAVVPGELPDFLPALLEFAASSTAGAALLGEHRVALDALALALRDAKSGYAPVLDAVLDALPSASRADRDALERYRAQGPPSEQVGLEPFAPPEVLGAGL